MANQEYNNITLYLRPISNIPEYRIRGACRWLMAHFPGQFKNEINARLYLLSLSRENPTVYKSILRRYFEASDYHVNTLPKRDPNRYYTAYSNAYGNDNHMDWSTQI
jgi:hypothetical protein